MTKAERVKLREAIRLIHAADSEGGDYHKGMALLCELAGLKMPELSDAPRISVYELAARVKGNEDGY